MYLNGPKWILSGMDLGLKNLVVIRFRFTDGFGVLAKGVPIAKYDTPLAALIIKQSVLNSLF
jgi:hypothetical protein